jgi:hypothetical protein
MGSGLQPKNLIEASAANKSDGDGTHADRQIAHRKLDLLIKTDDIAVGGAGPWT